MIGQQTIKYGKILSVVQILFVVLWLLCLHKTDAYFSVYVLCAAVGILCIWQNAGEGACPAKRGWLALVLCGGAFSAAVLLANYKIFLTLPGIAKLIYVFVCFLSGFIVGFHIMLWCWRKFPLQAVKVRKQIGPGRCYAVCFAAVLAIFVVHLFCAAYPGYLTPDSFNSLIQIQDGEYANNHPFWYTMTIKLFTDIGLALFGSVNAAVATFCFCQSVAMAAVFAYALVTLHQIGAAKWYLVAVFAVYALLPYNIVYSASLLKDIPFGLMALLTVVSLYRILKGIGNWKKLNYLLFAVGALGFCLMRTNGWVAFLVTSLVMLVALRKKIDKKLLMLILLVLLVGWLMTNPVLTMLNVESTDYIEILAVPFQQIARVITHGYTLDDYDRQLLEEIFDLDIIPQVFAHESVDAIKFQAFRQDKREYLKDNMGTYVKLWIRLGIKHPGEYLKAWIELTKGYWNAGYEYWRYYTGGENAELGIIRPTSTLLGGFFESYFSCMEKPAVFHPLYSIGLHVWMLFGCFVLNVMKKRKEFLLAIPGMVIVVGLWLGTPVYAEFRYAYPVLLTLPLILGVTIFQPERTK